VGRPVVLSNGEMFVGLNENGLVHDFYYPYVGQDNLTTSRSTPHKIGIWVDGRFSWVDDGSWQSVVCSEPDALVSTISLRSDKLQIQLEIRDCVDVSTNAFLRAIQVINMGQTDRHIRLFTHQVFQISLEAREDTAFYEPDGSYIFDYKGKTALVIYGQSINGPADQFAIGNYGIEGKTGTYLDAEDGELSGNLVEHGGVDSVLAFHLDIPAGHAGLVEYWIAAGKDQAEADYSHRQLLADGVIKRIHRTKQYFANWLSKGLSQLDYLDEDTKTEIGRSLLIIKAHSDSRGSILASADSSIYNYGRDYYAYCWPRDGAYAVWPLIKLGYTAEPKAFFDFCVRAAHRDGYLQHKFQPDGSFGSTWHPLVQEHHRELAIQEDETSIVLYMIAEYVETSGDCDYFRSIYNQFIKPATDFIAYFIDTSTGLPHASYDLWEQKFLTNTYTVFITSNALRRIAKLASEIMDDKDAAKWIVSAEGIDGNINKLFDQDKQYFIKGHYVQEDGNIRYDTTLDVSSMYGAFMFGGKARDSFALAQTVSAIESQLEAATPNGGIPRYLYDDYLQKNRALPGNPWFICTFWMARYYQYMGQTDRAQELMGWAKRHITPAGTMSEQIDPESGRPTGVSPLVWSHAEYIHALLEIPKA